jgi:hypothetical protein
VIDGFVCGGCLALFSADRPFEFVELFVHGAGEEAPPGYSHDAPEEGDNVGPGGNHTIHF